MTIIDIYEKAALSRSGLYMVTCDIEDDTGMIHKDTKQIVTEKELEEYHERKGKK